MTATSPAKIRPPTTPPAIAPVGVLDEVLPVAVILPAIAVGVDVIVPATPVLSPTLVPAAPGTVARPVLWVVLVPPALATPPALVTPPAAAVVFVVTVGGTTIEVDATVFSKLDI